MTRKAMLIAGSLLALILLTAMTVNATAPAAGDLLVFYSSDVHGELEPCG